MIHEFLVVEYLEWAQSNARKATDYTWFAEGKFHSDLLGYARWFDNVYMPYIKSLPDDDGDSIIPDSLSEGAGGKIDARTG